MVIDSWENGQYKEIWVHSNETKDDERAMCGLLNGDTSRPGDESPRMF